MKNSGPNPWVLKWGMLGFPQKICLRIQAVLKHFSPAKYVIHRPFFFSVHWYIHQCSVHLVDGKIKVHLFAESRAKVFLTCWMWWLPMEVGGALGYLLIAKENFFSFDREGGLITPLLKIIYFLVVFMLHDTSNSIRRDYSSKKEIGHI